MLWKYQSEAKRQLLLEMQLLMFLSTDTRKLQSYNCKEFSNNLVKSYLERVEVDDILGAHYHSQSQGAFEVFNNTAQIALSFVYENARQEETEWV